MADTRADDSPRAEIRSPVEARNARRVAPPDVEAEIERRLSELDG